MNAECSAGLSGCNKKTAPSHDGMKGLFFFVLCLLFIMPFC